MRIMFYMDWLLAITYLEPIYTYFKKTTDWDLFFTTEDEYSKDILKEKDYPIKKRNTEYDWAICCDKLSTCPSKNRINIFHQTCSKGQDYCLSNRNVYPSDISVVASEYHKKIYINEDGADEDKVIVAGISKFDTITEIPPKNKIPKILFAPTHNPELSAISVIGDKIYELDNLTVHLHYWTREEESYSELKKIYPIHDNREDSTELLVNSDIVIADYGSMILEALALGKMAIQIINPLAQQFYLDGVAKSDIDKLPEIDLPKRFGFQAHNIQEVKEIIKKYPDYKTPDFPIIENIGNYKVSKIIYDYIRQYD